MYRQLFFAPSGSHLSCPRSICKATSGGTRPGGCTYPPAAVYGSSSLMEKQSASVVPGDPALVYEILTGYEDIAEWMPHVAGVKLLAKEGDLVLAEVQLQGQKQRRFTMECIHSRDKEVIWRPVESDIPISQVRWDLAAAPEGRCTVSLAVDRRLSLARFTWSGIRFAQPRQWLRALRNQVSLFQPG